MQSTRGVVGMQYWDVNEVGVGLGYAHTHTTRTTHHTLTLHAAAQFWVGMCAHTQSIYVAA